MRNEWGLAVRAPVKHQAPSILKLIGLGAASPSTPMTPATSGLLGAGVGAAVGALAERGLMRGSGLAGGAIGAVVGGAGGYYYGKSKQPAASVAGTGTGSAAVQLNEGGCSSGTCPTVPVAMSVGGTLTVSPPTGGSVTNVTGPSTLVQGVVGNGVFSGKATVAGSTVLTVQWNNQGGTQYQTNVTVQAS